MSLPQTTPVWVGSTAYLVGARVQPTAPGSGTAWYCTVAGTSGLAEPTWPTQEPWTVSDGATIIWRLATSFRQNVRDGIVATLSGFKAANPWAITGISSSRPKAMANFTLPGVYIDDMAESVTYSAGVRTRTFSGLTVVLVVPVPDNDQASNATDALVDALLDAFTAAYHAADGSSITALTAVSELTIDEGGPKYLANLFTFADTSKAVGRT